MEKLVLKVPTIKCEGCVQNNQRVLTQKEGITLVEGDANTKEVAISYRDGEIGEEEIRSAIVQMGHQVA